MYSALSRLLDLSLSWRAESTERPGLDLLHYLYENASLSKDDLNTLESMVLAHDDELSKILAVYDPKYLTPQIDRIEYQSVNQSVMAVYSAPCCFRSFTSLLSSLSHSFSF